MTPNPSRSAGASGGVLEAYDGFAPFGHFHRDDITYYGLAVQFDL